jgi:hypothetical protein
MKWSAKAGVDEGIFERILASSNVSVETNLPEKPGRMAVLYVQPETADKAAVEDALRGQTAVAFSSDKVRYEGELAEAAERVLEKCGFMSENVELASLTQEGAEGKAVATYRDVYKGIPIEESYIICAFEGGRVVGVDRKWYSPVDTHDRKGEVISPMEALMRLLPDKDESERVAIRDVSLVYWVDPQGAREASPVGDTALPAWKITDSLGRVTYVQAYE